MTVHGTFQGQDQKTDTPCRKDSCPGPVVYREWESDCGGYEDQEYRCLACGCIWWVEGPDS